MRSLISLVLFLSLVSFAFSTPILVQHKEVTSSGSSTVSITLDSAPIDGHTLTIHVAYATDLGAGSGISGITQIGASWNYGFESDDDGGNTSASVETWYAYNVSGTSASISVDLASTYDVGISVCEWSGLLTSNNLDQTASDNDATTGMNSGTTGTTTQANELLITAYIHSVDHAMVSPGAGFSNIANTVFASSAYRLVVNYEAVTSIGAYQEIPDMGGVDPFFWAGEILTFKASAGGGGPIKKIHIIH